MSDTIPAEVTDARNQAAAAMRRLGHALMAHEADADLLRVVARAADDVARELEQQPPRSRDVLEAKRRMWGRELTDGERVSHFDECFVSGSQNPMGIAMDVRRDGDDMVADVTLGAAFEGAPGRSHGGIVAALLDDILGYLGTLTMTPAFTGTLTVNYLAPTPIGLPLELRARVLRREGRRMFTEAEARAEGAVIVTATATFVTVPVEAFRA